MKPMWTASAVSKCIKDGKSNANQVDRLLDLVKKLDGFLELGLLPQRKCKGLKRCNELHVNISIGFPKH